MRYMNTSSHRYGNGTTGEADFVGTIEYVGVEPEFLSGYVPALQTVGLTITDVRQGDVAIGDHVEVDVLVVAGNPHIGIGASGLPALDSTMVAPGALLQAHATRVHERWFAESVSTDGPQPSGNYAGAFRRR